MKIPCSGAVYDKEEIKNIQDAALQFYNVEGKYTEEFAKGLCDFFNMKYCVLFNSGSSANLLAISALMLPKDSEVITTACGFPTTLNPVIQSQLLPVFIDILRDTLTMDANQIEKTITEETRALLLSHTLGNPADMYEIMRLAMRYELFVIEDNCDSLGSKYDGRLTGTFGDSATLSFYPAHHITTGEGGAALTNYDWLYRRMLSLRNWGRDCLCRTGQDNACGKRFNQQFGKMPFGYDHKYIYTTIGYNLKMTNLQAAAGVAQLKKLPYFIEARRKNYALLYNGLSKYQDYFDFVQENGEASWFGFPLICKGKIRREEIVNFLESKGIATRPLFWGNLTKQPAYRDIPAKIGDLTNTDCIMDNLFWIGVWPGLREKEIEYIIEQFDEFMKGVK